MYSWSSLSPSWTPDLTSIIQLHRCCHSRPCRQFSRKNVGIGPNVFRHCSLTVTFLRRVVRRIAVMGEQRNANQPTANHYEANVPELCIMAFLHVLYGTAFSRVLQFGGRSDSNDFRFDRPIASYTPKSSPVNQIFSVAARQTVSRFGW